MTNNYTQTIKNKIIIAIPKGRILSELDPLFHKVKIIPERSFYKDNSRKLLFSTSDKNIYIIIVRSFDVVNFVAFGGAHLGIVGSDVIKEFSFEEIYAPVNLGIGKCRMSVAEPLKLANNDLSTNNLDFSSYSSSNFLKYFIIFWVNLSILNSLKSSKSAIQ